MKGKLNMVDCFHETFQIGKAKNEPHFITEEEYNLRYELAKEENYEYLEACRDNNLVEIADSLGDQLYVLCGTILKHGLQHKIAEVFNEIHYSNMSKLGPNGEPIFREDGKILKGKGYFKPNIKNVLDGNV